jgi:hypothetical protein
MFATNPDVVSDAKVIATEIIRSDRKILSTEFGGSGETIFVSIDPKAIIPIDSFELGGVLFYVGLGIKRN